MTDDLESDPNENAGAAARGSEVWVVVIEHRHGPDVTVHQTDRGAHDYLAAWCEEYWKDVSDQPMPDDPEELIYGYFESCNEFYSIHNLWVTEGR